MRLKDLFFKNFNSDYLLFLDNYYKKYSITKIKDIIKNEIRIYCKKENVKQIKERNITYWIIRGWSEEYAISKIKNINKNRKKIKYTILNYQYWMKQGYDENTAKQIVSDKQRKNALKFAKKRKEKPEKYKHMLSPMTIEFWMKKGFTKEESLIEIKAQRKLNIEYWLRKGYSVNESKIEISKFQKENSKKQVFKWNKLKNTLKYKQRYPTRIEYYLNKGFDMENAKNKLKERQTTFSKEICIKKYGEILGMEIFNERQHKWQDSLQKNGNMKSGFSKISQEFFYNIIKYYNEDDLDMIYFATKNKELRLTEKNQNLYLYDFVDLKNKKIIEYNGDLFHANPKIYSKNDCPNPFKKNLKAEDTWLKEKLKQKVAEEEGFDYLIIWDSEYRNNKEKTLKKTLDFLKL